jgi:hypothetical protein
MRIRDRVDVWGQRRAECRYELVVEFLKLRDRAGGGWRRASGGRAEAVADGGELAVLEKRTEMGWFGVDRRGWG